MSNNDHGYQRIAFPLEDRRNVTIDGQGSELIFHGRMTPFTLDRCSQVTIRNFTIDYDRPFFSQGEIVAASENHVDLRIDRENYPWRIEEERLVFTGPYWDGGDYRWVMLFVQFDPRTRAMVPNARYYLGKFFSVAHIDKGLDDLTIQLTASEVADGVVRLSGSFGPELLPGNYLTIQHELRTNPGVFITDCDGVTLENVILHHAGAMGIIAQLSRDLTLRRVQARPREGSDRLISVNADATHFLNCEGRIVMEDCVFENMLDDATNIHGIYTTVVQMPAADTVELALGHHQQQGINLYRPGDQVEFTDSQTLQPICTANVRASYMINSRLIEVTFENALDGMVRLGAAADNITRMPAVEIRRCRTGHNRPRGFLVSSHRRMLIEENTFYNSSSAIWVSGDATCWYESGPVHDLVIRNNRFLECGYGDGEFPITIAPEIHALVEGGACYHRNITIEDNEFQTRDGRILRARSVEGLIVRGNRHERIGASSPGELIRASVQLEQCSKVEVQEF